MNSPPSVIVTRGGKWPR